MAIPARRGSRKEVSLETSKKKGVKHAYFSHLEGFSLARILWVRGQGSDRTSDEDPQGR